MLCTRAAVCCRRPTQHTNSSSRSRRAQCLPHPQAACIYAIHDANKKGLVQTGVEIRHTYIHLPNQHTTHCRHSSFQRPNAPTRLHFCGVRSQQLGKKHVVVVSSSTARTPAPLAAAVSTAAAAACQHHHHSAAELSCCWCLLSTSTTLTTFSACRRVPSGGRCSRGCRHDQARSCHRCHHHHSRARHHTRRCRHTRHSRCRHARTHATVNSNNATHHHVNTTCSNRPDVSLQHVHCCNTTSLAKAAKRLLLLRRCCCYCY